MSKVYVPAESGRFMSPFEQYKHLNGSRYELIGPADPAVYERVYIGQMFEVRIRGEVIQAWPEELPGETVEVFGPDEFYETGA